MLRKTIIRLGIVTTLLGSVAVFLVLTAVSAGAEKSAGGGSGTFTLTGSMNIPRFLHRAVLLNTGQVLVVGGSADTSAELFNPARGQWTLTGSTVMTHQGGTATLLQNGEVLLAGGDPTVGGFSNPCTAAAELFNPATGNWTMTGSLASGRCYHTATLLSNGLVLVAGGSTASINGDSLASAELYNPTTGSWQTTGSLNVGRMSAAAELLGNGSVLAAAGQEFANGTSTQLASAEIFDPLHGRWSLTGNLSSPDGVPIASLLANGDVLVIRAAFFNPQTGNWTSTGSLPSGVTGGSTATLLGTGNGLATGFISTYNSFPPTNLAVLYNFSTNSYASTGPMNMTRNEDTATLLPNGQVLVAGGYNKTSSGFSILSSAELYTP